ncbi:hypothetical protein B2G71_10300 [Novosphingobium sp. PC22D]|uniref:hypothetical protein n=1 Tax=Novosphingobium sp. PC22D TaxID=1962403 RepID=UPI000BF04735|nr:hypothetical protein [Novosphingobium sp. PC22D]PEQ12688.1 hypothetical protein B2G71_10300 [Novosphingobium sp. PC22D]
MTMPNPRDIERIAKLIAMFDSDQAGERNAAFNKLTEYCSARSISLVDIGERLKRSSVIERQSAPVVRTGSHRLDAQRCLNSGIRWKVHERKFLEDMEREGSRPSDKQKEWLKNLCRRMGQHQWETVHGCY